ncbi:acyclic terpene utilization AtuA family protein [Microbispora sp. GKU 823]|uniref:acyclic terpene utilization AtuA family protein n=1 Tax=Microbispora sp. GKU 823 TaxID=1652100 RepID=UPI0009A42435|nr:acyclic terpene utilization AtuA family protein [Microbispora sp. GKU 823]OPG09465.1 hypothetical protein B1L11_26060 [Microbispora sp. GKU 823]
MTETRVLVPVGMLGNDIDPGLVAHGIELGADAIAVDAGSTDPGPFYLGSGQLKNADNAMRRDLRAIVPPARRAGIPVVIGSSGTSGSNAGVDWIAGLVTEVLSETGQTAKVARIYSEQDPDTLRQRLGEGRVHALRPAAPLDEDTIDRCERIVGVMGHEPIAAALSAGADIVVAGRASDAAVIASVPLLRGCPPGASWHAGKVAECGALCTTDPRSGGVMITVDDTGFVIEPLAATAACTPRTVAAHMLYENANPYRLTEPPGTLDVTGARYIALDERRVRVEGSAFEPATHHTMKLEGAALTGYRSITIAGIRDPHVLRDIDAWGDLLAKVVEDSVAATLGLTQKDYTLEVRLYGHNAVLGSRDSSGPPPKEVGVVLSAIAGSQDDATRIGQLASKYMLHLPLPDMDHLPSFALFSSPSVIPTGALYEFVLNHTIELDSPVDLVRTEWSAA